MSKPYILIMLILAGGLLALAACSRSQPEQAMAPAGRTATSPPILGNLLEKSPAAASASSPQRTFVATLHPLNSNITGYNPKGTARFSAYGTKMSFYIHLHGSPPGIQHWQNIHGFVKSKAAHCPTSSADANNDGMLDRFEADAISGPALVALNNNPAAMSASANTYPTASASGDYTYRESVPLDELQNNFGKKFNGSKLNLANSVVYVYGAPETTKLPASASSTAGAAAHNLVPIACGEIVAVPHNAPAAAPSS